MANQNPATLYSSQQNQAAAAQPTRTATQGPNGTIIIPNVGSQPVTVSNLQGTGSNGTMTYSLTGGGGQAQTSESAQATQINNAVAANEANPVSGTVDTPTPPAPVKAITAGKVPQVPFSTSAAKAAGYTLIPSSSSPNGYLLEMAGSVYDTSGKFMYSTAPWYSTQPAPPSMTTAPMPGFPNGVTMAVPTPTAAQPSITTGQTFSGNNINYQTFGNKVALAFSSPTTFGGSYVINGQTINFTGTLPTTYDYQSDLSKNNAAVDMAYNAINNLQLPQIPMYGAVAVPINIDLNTVGITNANYTTPTSKPTYTPTNPNAITGGGYFTGINPPTMEVQTLTFAQLGIPSVAFNPNAGPSTPTPKMPSITIAYMTDNSGNGYPVGFQTPTGIVATYNYNGYTFSINESDQVMATPIVTQQTSGLTPLEYAYQVAQQNFAANPSAQNGIALANAGINLQNQGATPPNPLETALQAAVQAYLAGNQPIQWPSIQSLQALAASTGIPLNAIGGNAFLQPYNQGRDQTQRNQIQGSQNPIMMSIGSLLNPQIGTLGGNFPTMLGANTPSSNPLNNTTSDNLLSYITNQINQHPNLSALWNFGAPLVGATNPISLTPAQMAQFNLYSQFAPYITGLPSSLTNLGILGQKVGTKLFANPIPYLTNEQIGVQRTINGINDVLQFSPQIIGSLYTAYMASAPQPINPYSARGYLTDVNPTTQLTLAIWAATTPQGQAALATALQSAGTQYQQGLGFPTQEGTANPAYAKYSAQFLNDYMNRVQNYVQQNSNNPLGQFLASIPLSYARNLQTSLTSNDPIAQLLATGISLTDIISLVTNPTAALEYGVGFGALNTGLNALFGQITPAQLGTSFGQGTQIGIASAPLEAGAPVAKYIGSILPKAITDALADTSSSLWYQIAGKAAINLPPSVIGTTSYFVLQAALAAQANGQTLTGDQIKDAAAFGVLFGLGMGGAGIAGDILSNAEGRLAEIIGNTGAKAIGLGATSLGTAATSAGVNYLAGSPIPAWEAAGIGAAFPLGMELLQNVGPRLRSVEGQGIDVNSLTFKVGKEETGLLNVVSTPDGWRIVLGTPSMADSFLHPQFDAEGNPISFFPTTKGFEATETPKGESSDLLTTSFGKSILEKTLGDIKEEMPVDAQYANAWLKVATLLSNARYPIPSEFKLEIKGLTPEQNDVITKLFVDYASEITELRGSISARLQMGEEFPRLPNDADPTFHTAEQATNFVIAARDALNALSGTDEFKVDPSNENLLLKPDGSHLIDAKSKEETTETYGSSGQKTTLGLEQTVPKNIEGVNVQSVSQSLKDKIASALSLRVYDADTILKSPYEWQKFLNENSNAPLGKLNPVQDLIARMATDNGGYVVGSAALLLQMPIGSFREIGDIDIAFGDQSKLPNIAEKALTIAQNYYTSIGKNPDDLVLSPTGDAMHQPIFDTNELKNVVDIMYRDPNGAIPDKIDTVDGISVRRANQVVRDKSEMVRIALKGTTDLDINAPKVQKAISDIVLVNQAPETQETKTTFAPNSWRVKDVIDPYAEAQFLNQYTLSPLSKAQVDENLNLAINAAKIKFGLTDEDFNIATSVDMTPLLKGNVPATTIADTDLLFRTVAPTTPIATTISAITPSPAPVTLAPTPTTITPTATTSFYDPLAASQQQALYNSLLGTPSTQGTSPNLTMAMGSEANQANQINNSAPLTTLQGMPVNSALGNLLLNSEVSQANQNYMNNLYLKQLAGAGDTSGVAYTQGPISANPISMGGMSAMSAAPISASSVLSQLSSPYASFSNVPSMMSSLYSSSLSPQMMSSLLSSGLISYDMYNSLMSSSMAEPYSPNYNYPYSYNSLYNYNYPYSYGYDYPYQYPYNYPYKKPYPYNKTIPVPPYGQNFLSNPRLKGYQTSEGGGVYVPDILTLLNLANPGPESVNPANIGITGRGYQTPAFLQQKPKNPA